MMTVREAMATLVREGWAERPGKGAHTVFRKAGFPNVIVANRRGDIPPGTLRSICKAAGQEYPPEWQQAGITVRQYLGVAERGADGWWISFPGVTSAGDRLAELAANARDALATAIELLQKDNKAVP